MLCARVTFVHAQEKENSNKWTSSRPDGHATISIMADHVHHQGEFMLSYRYMIMDMKDLRQGTNDATIASAYTNYMVTPLNMSMKMHMLGVMYAPSNKLTLLIMANYLENAMNLQMRNGNVFQTSISGLGDISVAALYALLNKNRKAMHINWVFLLQQEVLKKKAFYPYLEAMQYNYPILCKQAQGLLAPN